DVEEKVRIAEQAIFDNPGVARLTDVLKRVQAKHAAIQTVVMQAREHEEADRFPEALACWKTLRTLYPEYPGLSTEIERIEKKLPQKQELERRKRVLDRIRALFEPNDPAEALLLITQALEDLPGDQELLELQAQANLVREHRQEAQKLLFEGTVAFKENRHNEGLALIRKAYELDSHNETIRSALVDALLICARSITDTDPAGASALSLQVLD